jgi:CRISPR-associated protein Cas5t
MTEALRIELEMPQAHFRKPWSYKIRHTYPIPPFSTVIGLLCNILGDSELLFKHDFGLSVFSQFSSIDSSYIWLRNLKPKAHINKYMNPQNRELRTNNIEHPGGQSPVKCFVLNLIVFSI